MESVREVFHKIEALTAMPDPAPLPLSARVARTVRRVVMGLVALSVGACSQCDEVPPILTTDEPTDISATAATLNGTVTGWGDNLEAFDSRIYFCLSTDAANVNAPNAALLRYDRSRLLALCPAGPGGDPSRPPPQSQSVRVTGLQPGTTYYVQGMLLYEAPSSTGPQDAVSPGGIRTFQTLSLTPPSVTTGSVTSITTGGATVAGTVTSDVNNPVTERGICFGTSPDPVRSGSCVVSGSGTGSFSATLSGLAAGTRYFARAFAAWSGGVAYGSSADFTTQPAAQPGFTLSAQTASQLVNRGTTGAAFGLTVARSGGFTGAVTVAVNGLPTGVSATVQSPGTGTSGSVAFVVGAQAALGTYPLTLVGSGTGVSSQSLPFSLIVSEAPSLRLEVPVKLDMSQGGSATTSVSIVRTAWTGSVSLQLANLPSGITGSLVPQSTTGSTVLLNLAVAQSVAVGSYPIEVRATGANGTTATGAITINVSP
jgi:hypothetical protein